MEKFQLESHNPSQLGSCVNILRLTIAGLTLSACTHISPNSGTEDLDLSPPQKKEVEVPESTGRATTRPESIQFIMTTKPISKGDTQPKDKQLNINPKNKPYSKGVYTGKKGPLGDKICSYGVNVIRLCTTKPPEILLEYDENLPGETIIRKGKEEIIPPKTQHCTFSQLFNPKTGAAYTEVMKCVSIKNKKIH